MTNSVDTLKPIPTKRYFTLKEMCELIEISPDQFARWQHENGVVVGYGGDRYSRADVVKLRKLKETFDPFVDPFNNNGLDAEGNPSIKAHMVRKELEEVLAEMEKVLAK